MWAQSYRHRHITSGVLSLVVEFIGHYAEALKANDECAKSSAACYLGTIIGPLNSLDTSNDRRVHAAFAIARQARKEAITAC